MEEKTEAIDQANAKKQTNAFEDFFECSEIDNQDYSEFINDQSQFMIGQNGNEEEEPQTNRNSDRANKNNRRSSASIIQRNNNAGVLRPETQTEDINYIDVNNIVSLIRAEDKEKEKWEKLHINNQQNRQIIAPQYKKLQEEPQVIINQVQFQNEPILKEKQLINKSRRITKETMMLEPLPLFDCMFCVKNSKIVFNRLSERALNKKYGNMKKQIENQELENYNQGSINFESKLSQNSIENFLHTDFNDKIYIDDQIDPETRYLQDSLNLQIMIQNLPLHYIAQYSNNQSEGNASPRQYNKSLMTLQSNVTQFMILPNIKISHEALDNRGYQLKNKLSSMILQSRLRHNQTHAAIQDRNNFMTSPTFLGHENQTSSHLNTLMFNTMTGGMKALNFRDNMVIKDFILEENNQYFEENVTIEKWARTQRQRKLMNISFESDFFNIYNPVFSSDESQKSRSLSSIERSVYHDFIAPSIIIRSGNQSDSSSSPSVAEERDTISVTPNAITPNLSRIMNICSISKIEQPSIITADSDLTPMPFRAPKSQMSLNKPKPNKLHQFPRHHQMTQSYKKNSEEIDDTPIVECLLIQEPIRYKQKSNYQPSSSKNKLQLSQISSNENMRMGSLFSRGQGRNISNIIMSQNHIRLKNKNNYKTEPNDSMMLASVQNTLPYQDTGSPGKQSPVKILTKIKQSQTKYYTKTVGTKSQMKKISIDKSSNAKNKLSVDQNIGLMKRNSSNQLLNFEQSSIINPYETLYNSPNHLNFMDKSTTVGGENRTSLLTTGVTDMMKGQYEKSRSILGKKSASSVMRNSQSMSNLNLQPRAFITRNVKIRKSNNQSTFAAGHNYPMSASEFQITPQNNLTRRQIDENMREEIEKQSQFYPPEQHNSMQTIGLLSKKEQVNLLKKQRLARDILLSKVYNQNNQQLAFSNQKKTNSNITNQINQNHQMSMQHHKPTHQSQGSISKVKPQQQNSNFKASLKKHAVLKMIDSMIAPAANHSPSQNLKSSSETLNINQALSLQAKPGTSGQNYFNQQTFESKGLRASAGHQSRSNASGSLISNQLTQIKYINLNQNPQFTQSNQNSQSKFKLLQSSNKSNKQSLQNSQLQLQQQTSSQQQLQSASSVQQIGLKSQNNGNFMRNPSMGGGQLQLIYNSHLPSINNFLK